MINFINLIFLQTIFLSFLPIIITLIKIICVLLSVAYFTIAERKVMAAIQRRLGPNIEGGPFGLIQPIADGLKSFIKEFIIPSHANNLIFIFSPLLIFTLSISGWAVIPFWINFNFLDPIYIYETKIFFIVFENYTFSDNNFGVLYLLTLSSLNVYGIILGGWSSNSKYAFLGALRSASQMISYEVSIGLTILPVILLTGSFNLTEIILIQQRIGWFIFPLLPCFVIFFISMLAETNRAPFDLPEAEAELVAGYNVEYGSMAFALYLLGEYSNMLLMSTLIVLFFLGGWSIPFIFSNFFLNYLQPIIFAIKLTFFCFMYILVRATFPRYRYDQLMDIGWKIFLPFTLAFYILVCSLLISFNIIPIIHF